MTSVRNRKAVLKGTAVRRRPVSQYAQFLDLSTNAANLSRKSAARQADQWRFIMLTPWNNEELINSDMQMLYGNRTIVAKYHGFFSFWISTPLIGDNTHLLQLKPVNSTNGNSI